MIWLICEREEFGSEETDGVLGSPGLQTIRAGATWPGRAGGHRGRCGEGSNTGASRSDASKHRRDSLEGVKPSNHRFSVFDIIPTGPFSIKTMIQKQHWWDRFLWPDFRQTCLTRIFSFTGFSCEPTFLVTTIWKF